MTAKEYFDNPETLARIRAKDAAKDEAKRDLLSGKIPIKVSFDPNLADGWGGYTYSFDVGSTSKKWNTVFDVYDTFPVYPLLPDQQQDGLDITAAWLEYVTPILAQREEKATRESQHRAEMFAKAKATGQPQLVDAYDTEMDEPDNSYGTIGVYIRPDGTTFQKVTNRAY